MILAGLTGGIGSGKSQMALVFERLGAYLIDADQLAREAVQPGSPAHQQIIDLFGPTFLNPDRSLNRAKLARLIFEDENKREQLNAIIHPYVFAEEKRLQKEIGQKDPGAVILFVAPLLIETGADRRMQKVILVSANRETQLKRIIQRDGLTNDEALQRLEAQLPLEQKKDRAHYIIDGTQSIESLEKQIRKIYRELKNLANPSLPR